MNDPNHRFGLPWPVIAIAVMLHVLLLSVSLPWPEPSDRPNPVMEIDFVRSSEPPINAYLPQPVAPVPERAEPDPETAVKIPSQPGDMPTGAGRESDPATITHDPEHLRRQALVIARQGIEADEPKVSKPGLSFQPIPTLPSATGWLNEHIGTVSPATSHWQDTEGASHSRLVRADGQVYCFSQRAPTPSEFFNPWMSAAISMVRRCGRQRPESARAQDIWHRSPSG